MKQISERTAILETLNNLLKEEKIERNHYQSLIQLLNLKFGLYYEKIVDDVYEKFLDEKNYVFLKKHDECQDFFNPNAKTFGSIIQSDNLLALFLLQNTHRNKVDLIYIDPPYNKCSTGTTYKDDFHIEKNKRKMVHIDGKSSFRHSEWLSLIEPRLKLAKKLLKDTGVIAISIDDNELYNLKLLMDDIFGENCFKKNLIFYKGSGMWTENNIRDSHEYILLYENKQNLSNYFFKSKEKGKLNPLLVGGVKGNRSKAPKLFYEIICPFHEKTIFPINKNKIEKRWAFTKEKYFIALKNKRIVCQSNSKSECKLYSIPKNSKECISSVLNLDKINWLKTHSGQGSVDLEADWKNLTEPKSNTFNYPKPVNLLTKIFEFLTPKNGLILDFYAGSGTTACATAELNKLDNGTRKFILISNDVGDQKSKEPVFIFKNILYERLKNNSEKYDISCKTFMTETDEELKKRSIEDNYYSCKKEYQETCQNLLEILASDKENIFLDQKKKIFEVNETKYGFQNDHDIDFNLRNSFILRKK